MIPFCFTCFTCYTYVRRQYPSIIIKNSFRFVSSNCNICNNCNRTILKKLTFLLSVPKHPSLSHIRSHQFRAVFPSLYQHAVSGLYSNLSDLGKHASFLQSKPAKQTKFIFIILSMIRSNPVRQRTKQVAYRSPTNPGETFPGFHSL